jgi:aminopeptidase N
VFRDDAAAFNRAIRELYRFVVKEKIGPAVVSRPEDIFADNTYLRGALTLQALRYEVGDKAFFRTLRSFYDLYRYGNAMSDDFVKVAVKEGHSPGVRRLLQAWLYDEAVPPLTQGTDAATMAAEVGPVTLPLTSDTRRR